MMRKLILWIALCCQVMGVMAQKKAPKWMDKQRKAVITVTTYGKDNVKKTSGIGFFVSEKGEALSAYSLFEDVEKAVVTDVDGHEFPVTRILGADEMYDVIKFQVELSGKNNYLTVANDPIAQGTTVYLMPFSKEKIKTCQSGTISEVSKLKDPFSYYKLTMPLESNLKNAPILTEDGKVFGLAQEDASGNQSVSFAVSAGYANNLHVTSADAFSASYSRIGIKKAWPLDAKEAQISMYLLANTQDAKTYLTTLNDFIESFPNVADGYLSRASHYAYHRSEFATSPSEQAEYLKKAMDDLETASKYTAKKSEAWYQRAKLIYGVASADTTLKEAPWTMDVAHEAIQKAIAEEDSPIYHQLEGDIYYYKGDFEKALTEYMKVNQSDMASSLSWYSAAKAKKNIRGSNIGEIINMVDSAIVKGENAAPEEIASYLLERVDLRLKLMQFKEAVDDYNLYFVIMRGNVSDRFFYFREQAKFRNNDLDGALADIQTALRFNPGEPTYHAEEGSIYIRKKEYEKALASIDQAIRMVPDFASCYRLRGVCLIHQNKKAEAMEAFKKAKELGDPVADKLIKQHSK